MFDWNFILRTVLVLGVILLGIILRIHNLSPFTIYPDSYQSLIVAINLHTYQNVVGFLGTGGMLYPDFFMWTRPGYPLVINFVDNLTHDMTLASRLISFVAGVLAIPVAYFYLRSVNYPESVRSAQDKFISGSQSFKDKIPNPFGLAQGGRVRDDRIGIFTALAGAFLLAISFYHTVWSGFIMTETLGVLFMLLFLWSLFANLNPKSSFLFFRDLLTGVLLAAAVVTRYEYILVIFPMALLLFTSVEKSIYRLLGILIAFFLSLAIVFSKLFPVNQVLAVVVNQLHDLLIRGGVIAVSFIFILLFYFLLAKSTKESISKYLQKFVIVFIWAFFAYLILQLNPFVHIDFLYKDLSFARSFIRHDFLISVFSLFGLTMLIKNRRWNIVSFVLLSCVFLGVVYNHVNPEMDRYMTHLLPFLLIPSSFGFAEVLKNLKVSRVSKLPKALFIFILLVVTIFQIFISFQGLRYLNDSSWFRQSYEDKSAKILGKLVGGYSKLCHAEFVSASHEIPNQVRDDSGCDYILLTSFPEPYYYNLRFPTQSLNDSYPFIYIGNSQNVRNVIVVEDIGMRDIFPQFDSFIQNHLGKYKVTEYYVHENYHYTVKSVAEKYPVVVYRLQLNILKTEIGNIKEQK